MGVMSGTLDLVQRAYLGHRDPRRRPALRPAAHRPARRALAGRCSSAAPRSACRSSSDRLTVVALTDGHGPPVRVGVRDDVRELRPGEPQTFELATPREA